MATQVEPPNGVLWRELLRSKRNLVAASAGISSVLASAVWMLVLCLNMQVAAQNPQPETGSSRAERAVVAAATDRGVRFTAASGDVVEMRLQVYSTLGEKVFDSDFRRGNVLDWAVNTSPGQPGTLSDDEYLCLLTLRDLSGRLRQRRGVASVQSGAARLRAMIPTEAPSAAQIDAIRTSREVLTVSTNGSVVEEEGVITVDGEHSSVTVTAHDGDNGKLTSTRGALTFSTGDIFSGNDVERVRITPEGKVGIGTETPEATLDVAGTIRATGALRAAGGIEFADGTRLNSSAGKLVGTSD